MNRDISNNSDVLYRTLFNYLNNLVSVNSRSSEQVTSNDPNIDYFNILNTSPQQLNSVYGNFLENFVTNQINLWSISRLISEEQVLLFSA